MSLKEIASEFLKLVEVCLLMTEAGRYSISVEEMVKINNVHFKIENIIDLMKNKKLIKIENENVILIKTKEWLQEKEKELNHNIYAYDMRIENGDNYIWTVLPYKYKMVIEELLKNYDSYKNQIIDEKEIYGLGRKSIVLLDQNEEKSFHTHNPQHARLNAMNTFGDGHALGVKIIKKYGDCENNFHLKYITEED